MNQLFAKIHLVRKEFLKGLESQSQAIFALFPLQLFSNISDKPSQPGELEILSISKDSVNLQWEKPECDGGKEILGYWVEYRQSGDSAWKKSSKDRIKDRQFTIGGLLEATEYEFRVFAENETGLSRPRRTAMSVKTKLTCK